uniref:Uncharacterized protein n=1 Tax=Panagrolaimus sp. ES5 TaxID=591445 RepID=A0AC34FSN4_9BILA
MKLLLFFVTFYLLYFVVVLGYPDKRPVLTVEEVSSEEEEKEEGQVLDHPWSCGTDAFSLLISEGTIDKDCPEAKNQTATEKNKLCHEDDAHVFCNLVRQLGESAYNASGHFNSTGTDSNDPLADLLSTGEALNQTSSEYYDYERNEKPASSSAATPIKKIHHQKRRSRSVILNAAEILSDPVVTRLVL